MNDSPHPHEPDDAPEAEARAEASSDAAPDASAEARTRGGIVALAGRAWRAARTIDERVWSDLRRPDAPPPGIARRAAQVASLAVRGFVAHDLALRAASLTYATVLSLVPLLAVAFSILQALGVQDTLAERLVERITAGSEQAADQLVEHIRRMADFVNETNTKGLTGMGMAGLLLVSISMLRTVERTMNVVWDRPRGRTIGRMISDYVSLMIVAPLVLATGVYAQTLVKVPAAFPYAETIDVVLIGPLLKILQLVTTWGGFVFIYSFMPNAKVRWVSATIGGLIAGTVWATAQAFFLEIALALFASRYNAIYQSFAWVFIQMIWIQVSWTILLAGAEIAHAHQTLDDHRRRRRPWRGTAAERETLALRVGAVLARAALGPLDAPFRAHSAIELADELRAPTEAVEETLARLERAGLVVRQDGGPKEVGARERRLLCRSPRDVRILDLLRVVRHGSVAPPEPDEAAERDRSFLAEAGRDLSRLLEERTLKDLAELPNERIRTLIL